MYYMATKLGDWLLKELEKRNWSQNELARRAGISSGTVSNLITGTKTPEQNTLIAIAEALKIPKETVLRAAEILPPIATNSEKESELIYLFRLLPKEEQDYMLRHMQATISILEQEGKIKHSL